jgi:2-polyprenyl-3-methyl-5-hydroxy-6-metoxy-1,4-benzoquinol methylase
MDWDKAQEWEKKWWGDCTNTYGEETKQLHYAEKMGLQPINDSKGVHFDLEGKSVLDIGGGAVSLLLKCTNFKYAKVTDPLPLPEWIKERYFAAGIQYIQDAGEVIHIPGEKFDEVWIYNVLQHTEDPARIIENSRNTGKIIRVFEWLEIGISDGHIQNLTEKKMNEWLHGEGKVEVMNSQLFRGKCYYGIFPTE